MASTYSTNLKIELIGTGEQAGTWGATTNTNLGTAIEQAIAGKADITFSSTTETLTLTDTNAAQDARAIYLNLGGTPGGAATLEVPAIEKPYIVKNGTGETVTVKVSGQTGISVPNGKTMWLYNNGTDVVNAIDNLPSGTTLNGATIRSGNIDLTSEVTGTLPVANGGTGRTSLTSNNVILGAGTSQVGFVAPGTSGNVLTSNGTTWVSSPASGGGSGAIVQSLTFTKSVGQTFSTSSEVSISSWSATPSITISSASNRARATLYIPLYLTATSGTTTGSIVRIKSGGTTYTTGYPIVDSQGGTFSTTATLIAELPAGSGTKTFDVTIQNGTANIQTDINLSAGPTYLILEEIAP